MKAELEFTQDSDQFNGVLNIPFCARYIVKLAVSSFNKPMASISHVALCNITMGQICEKNTLFLSMVVVSFCSLYLVSKTTGNFVLY